MGSTKYKIFFKKAAAALLFAVFLEAWFIPSFNEVTGTLLKSSSLDGETGSYIACILGDSKTGLSEQEEARLAEVIIGESNAHKIDPLFVLALIQTESSYYNWSESIKGAMGLMQILPATGKSLAAELDIKWKGNDTLFNPYLNVRMGVYYFTSLMGIYDYDVKEALSAYNAGPAPRGGGSRQGFANKVMANYRDLKERVGYQ